jgi:hypothetical protein
VQRTPCGGAQDAQTRGADAPSARACEVVEENEEAGARRPVSRLICLSSRPAAGTRRSRGEAVLARLSCSVSSTTQTMPSIRHLTASSETDATLRDGGRVLKPERHTTSRYQLVTAHMPRYISFQRRASEVVARASGPVRGLCAFGAAIPISVLSAWRR